MTFGLGQNTSSPELAVECFDPPGAGLGHGHAGQARRRQVSDCPGQILEGPGERVDQPGQHADADTDGRDRALGHADDGRAQRPDRKSPSARPAISTFTSQSKSSLPFAPRKVPNLVLISSMPGPMPQLV